MPERFLLCSASPRRAAILTAAGILFESGPPPDVDETPPPGAPIAEVAEALAVRKARHVATRVAGRWVVCADTVVVLEGAVLGKPADANEAVRMLRRLSGRRHEVITGVALARDGLCHSASDRAVVTFRPLTDDEIAAYVATGEPFDKAGAYAIQGGAANFVAHLDGRLDTVVGLPVVTLQALLGRVPATN